MLSTLIFLWWIPTSLMAAELSPDSSFGKNVAHCKPGATSFKHVWLMKQWHADGAVDTHDRMAAKALPQAPNQTALFRQLDQWIAAKKLSTLVAEGCEGKLTRESKFKMNGWTVAELEVQTDKPHFDDEVVASVPEKLKARYGNKLEVLCGDREELIRAQLLAFSDVRGILGFITRLSQNKDDPSRLRGYLEGVIELYQLPKETTVGQALKRLQKELLAALARVHLMIDKRNAQVMRVIETAPTGEIAVVYGGLHTAGLVALLESHGVACDVFEPANYQSDETELLKQLDQSVKKLAF